MLRLFVSVPESFGPFLQPGLTADVTVPQLPDRHFPAKFLTVARGFDVSTRTATTVFTIDNEDRALWPGSYAQVHLTAPVDQKRIHDSVYRVGISGAWDTSGPGDRGRSSALKPITVSRLLDSAVEVAEGISTISRIVNNPSAALLEGDKVRIVTPAPGYDLITTEAPASQVTPGPQVPRSNAEPGSKEILPSNKHSPN